MTHISEPTKTTVRERVSMFLESHKKDVEDMVKEKTLELSNDIREINQQMDKWYRIKATTSDTKAKDNADLALSLLEDEKSYLLREIKRFRGIVAKKSKDASQVNLEAIKAMPIGDIMPSQPKHSTQVRATYICPLHNERTASFIWNKDKNTYKCFGCGVYGDVISLFCALNNVDFKEAIHRLSTA